MEKFYSFAQIEKETQALWRENNIYRFDPDSKAPVYSIDTPPPTVSGSLHIGHLFSFTQAEIIARFHRMQGKTFLPLRFRRQRPADRAARRARAERPRRRSAAQRLIALCRETSARYEKEFRDFWESLGFSADWNLQYRTVSPAVQKLAQEKFLELVRMGKAYLKESPVLWCTECRTSIAQAELETADRETAFSYLPPLTCGDETIEVATTRPELLFGCVCLFVHPEDARYRRFIGKNRAGSALTISRSRFSRTKRRTPKRAPARFCAPRSATAPTPAWYAEHGLPYRRVLLPDGKIAPEVPYLAGLRVPAARAEILRLFEERDSAAAGDAHPRRRAARALRQTRRDFALPPVVHRHFKRKDRFLRAADEIRWYPPQMKSRYTAWVENLKWDWCISRQRYFGVRSPVWYCKSCGRPAFRRARSSRRSTRSKRRIRARAPAAAPNFSPKPRFSTHGPPQASRRSSTRRTACRRCR